MSKLTKSLMAALIMAGSAVQAQNSDPETGLNMGAPAAPEVYVKATHGDWTVQCVEVESAERCEIHYPLTAPNGSSIGQLAFFPVPEGGEAVAGVRAFVPLGVLLSEPLLIAVDDGVPRAYPYTVCDQQVCMAQFGFRAQDLEAFVTGTKGIVAITPFQSADNGPMMIEVNLEGFGDAVASMNGE